MTNLLTETLEEIAENGYTSDQIIFIGSDVSGHSCTWAEFEKLANREYDSGYGGAEVASDLKIVFADGAWLSRGEYDGSEWWEIKKPFTSPQTLKPITNLFGGYNTLQDSQS